MTESQHHRIGVVIATGGNGSGVSRQSDCCAIDG